MDINKNTGTVSANKFTYVQCKESAQKWGNRGGFKSKHRAGYEFAKAMNWLNDISKDLGWKIPNRTSEKMTDDEVKTICKEFKNRTQLRVSNRRVYDIARVRCLLGEIFK